MSDDFWKLFFKFHTPFGKSVETLSVDMQNPATSPKDQTLKLSGCVSLEEIQELTRWSFIAGKTDPLKYKITGITPNGIVEGCFPTSMTFSVMHFTGSVIYKKWDALFRSRCQNGI